MADAKPSISIEVDGTVHTVYLDDVNGLEHRDFRRVVGVPLERVKLALVAGSLSMIEVAAGIVWLDRRRSEPDLSYDGILESLSDAKYDVVEGKDNPPD